MGAAAAAASSAVSSAGPRETVAVSAWHWNIAALFRASVSDPLARLPARPADVPADAKIPLVEAPYAEAAVGVSVTW
jgi:hypothetical protein